MKKIAAFFLILAAFAASADELPARCTDRGLNDSKSCLKYLRAEVKAMDARKSAARNAGLIEKANAKLIDAEAKVADASKPSH
jgi:hypothetical protein